MPAKKSSSKKPARNLNKKSMKRTKGGLLPAVMPSGIKASPQFSTSFTGGVMPSGGQITV